LTLIFKLSGGLFKALFKSLYLFFKLISHLLNPTLSQGLKIVHLVLDRLLSLYEVFSLLSDQLDLAMVVCLCFRLFRFQKLNLILGVFDLCSHLFQVLSLNLNCLILIFKYSLEPINFYLLKVIRSLLFVDIGL
jgi:hypothetical protein